MNLLFSNKVTMSKLLDGLNPAQREAVTHTIGPLLITAGPGSGKTRTVVHSIAHAIENGEDPSKIAAFTFTRKAAGELRKRVGEIVTKGVTNDAQISTFHSFCGSVVSVDFNSLRMGNEQEFIVKELTKRAEIDYIQYHNFPESDDILRFIRRCKANNIGYSAAGSDAKGYVLDPQMLDVYVDIYKKYEQFADDSNPYTRVQLLTYALFKDVPEVKAKWQEKFSLIFVDEYQDTDPVQYEIIKALAEKHQNLRVVGDDDQGIYGWRGADIHNILNFEEDYPNAKVISLGQNYRSTQRIVGTSRALVDFNLDRREKELFTKNFEGEKVKHLHCKSDEEEASTIATFVHRSIDQGGRLPSDFAVLYRNNKQAPAFKKAFKDLGIRVHDSSDTDTTGVSMMTIHKSKGLEFPNVFVVGICQELLPNYYNRDEKDWDEEIRLLYVAMTRAENWLCLSSYDYDKYKRGQSPFLERGYIPSSLLESIGTLENTPIPPAPEAMIAPKEPFDYIEPLPEKLLGSDMTVIGVDPGNIGAWKTNVGWSVTRKVVDGYSVLDHDTQCLTGEKEYKLEQIKHRIKSLVESFSPDSIAVEKFEVATEKAKEDWFYHVAGCVATIRSISHQHGIECHLYTPQQVKYIATHNRNASKLEVQKGIMQICNLQQIPEPHHSADAIATSLCYLRSYLNSSRFEGNKRKKKHYEASCDYLGKKQYEAAVDELKEAINIDPIYTDAHYELGRAYLAQCNLKAAENAAKKALGLTENNYPDSQKLLDAIVHYRFGCTSLSNSEWNKAIDKFKESIKLEPIFTEAHCGLSQAYLEVDNLGPARNSAEEALRLRNEHPPARKLLVDIKMRYYNNGKIYFKHEQYNQAIFGFQQAIEIDKNFKGAHRFVGEAYLKLGDLETAEKKAREALQIDPNYKLAQGLLEKIKQKHKEHGDDYRKKKAFAKALTSYQQAIRIDDKYKEAYHNLGILYRRMKKYDRAITAYQKVIDIDERSHVTYNDFSFVYREIGETAKAVNLLKRAIEIKPDYQKAYYNLADTYFEMEKLQNASETVLEALRLDANDQDTLKLSKNVQRAYLKEGYDYFRQGDLAAAEIAAKTVLRLDSNDQLAYKLLNDIKQTYYEQGLVYIESRAYAEAISVLQKSVEIDGDFKEAHYSLGETYFKIGDLEVAEKQAREALRIDPNYELASRLLVSIKEEYYKCGLTSFEQNEWKVAEKFSEDVLRIDPNYEPAYRLLKQAYYEQGFAHIQNDRYVEGINKLQKAKDIDPNCEKTHYYLGWAYLKLDKLKEAQLAIKNALSIQPNYPLARELLAEINDVRNWLKLGRAEGQRLARWIAKFIGF